MEIEWKEVALKSHHTYRSRSAESRAAEASKRQKRRYSNVPSDKEAEFGPPDKSTNFNTPSQTSNTANASKKMAIEVKNNIIQYVPDSHPELMGKRVQMKFEQTSLDTVNGLKGAISSYDGINQKYGIYFPCDEETVFAS